jgi:hypothetical protein
MLNNTRSYSVIALWLIIFAIACVSNGSASAANDAKPTKLALLVGIDEYKYISNLRGAVNDVRNMKALLVESFGFPDDEEHIRVLTNDGATREAIIKSIEEHLIAKASKDSIVVFHYSGHGSQLKDANDGDETDGWDETLVAHDSGHQDPHPNRDITDDELNALLGKLTDKTPNVTLILDSCHSGTAVRGSGLARTAAPDMRPPPKRERTFTSGTRGARQSENSLRLEDSRYALISGSAAEELSYELLVDGQPYGAMTWHLTDQIRRVGAQATYRDIMDVVKAQVSAKYPVQHPQLEGPGEDQFVFNDKSLVPAPSVLASPAGGKWVTLAAGQVHGVTKGSIYEVYPAGTKSFGVNEKSIARVEVSAVDITTSTAKVIQGKVTQPASRAVEREHYWPDVALSIYFQDLERSKTLQQIRAKLLEYKHIGQVKTDSGYDLLLREKNGFIVTEAGDPTEISPRVSVTDSDAVSRVVKQVTHWAMWFNTLGIDNQQPELGVEFELKVAEGARESARQLADREVNLTLSEGELFAIEITNKSQQKLYIALLDLSSDGSVAVVYPAGGQQEFVAPGQTWSKRFKTSVPEGRDSVRDVLKLIATTNFADFSFLNKEAVPRGPELAETRGRSRNPLEQLLANAAMGTTRGVMQVEIEDWTTVNRVLEVRRRN